LKTGVKIPYLAIAIIDFVMEDWLFGFSFLGNFCDILLALYVG
jgi:hypothetical protein